MKAVIVNFRGSPRKKNFSQLILKVEEIISKKEAERLLNKDVKFKTKTGKEIKGKVTALHGNNGCVRAKFEKGLPGQALGKEVEII